MKNAEFSGKPQNSFPTSSEDIPAALRDTPDVASKTRVHPLVWILAGLAGFIALAVISGFVFFLTSSKNTPDSQTSPTGSIPARESTSDNSVTSGNNNIDEVLNHLAYSQASEADLRPISANGRIRMRTAAAQKFQEMKKEAGNAGVILVPISGFRTVEEQQKLFFGIGAQRNQTPAQRAAVSAPPGYSEHHTGYAVDIGDGRVPATNLSTNFENTKAFKWLEANAARYGFELSFPKDNPQGVSYEPWHWRFVGDRDSLETFYKAQNIKPQLTPEK
ncbi:MAG: D-alanyl-D-alanine carboxypeptidase family protein [Nostocaceae cyanobacterium]|nr:D-alanyl-D-alanine carboxypeptidase family protein [Nostocaceae cyanobacterium]